MRDTLRRSVHRSNNRELPCRATVKRASAMEDNKRDILTAGATDPCSKCKCIKQVDLLDYQTWTQVLCQCLPEDMDPPSPPMRPCPRDSCDSKGKQWATCQECHIDVHTRCMSLREFETYRDGVFNCQTCHNNGPDTKPVLPKSPAVMTPQTPTRVCTLQGLTGPDRTVLLPTFAGNEAEDPRLFLSVCESKLDRHNVHRDDWTEVTANRLRGTAATWWSLVKQYQVTWETFSTQLLNRFESTTDHIQHNARLYHEQQREKETIEEFTHRKVALFRRLHPEQPVEQVLDIVVALASPVLRPYLRTVPRTTVEHFVKGACECEKDVSALREFQSPLRSRPSPVLAQLPTLEQPTASARSPATLPQHQQTHVRPLPQSVQTPVRRQARSVPPTPCLYCPGNQLHWHNECPNHPRHQQGN